MTTNNNVKPRIEESIIHQVQKFTGGSVGALVGDELVVELSCILIIVCCCVSNVFAAVGDEEVINGVDGKGEQIFSLLKHFLDCFTQLLGL
jgi:hypothetical protein